MAEGRYALVREDVVRNVVLWDPDAAPGWSPPDGLAVVPAPAGVGPRWTWDGNAFHPPVPESRRSIPVLEFRDRWTDAEQDALYQAATANTAAGRRLRRWLDDAAATPEGMIDLDSERVRGGMAQLVQAGILTAARRDAILA